MSSTNPPEPTGSPSWSLAARLTAWYACSAFLLIAAATGYLYWVLVVNLVRQGDEFLADKVHILQTLLRERPDDLRMLREEVELEPAARQYGQVYVRILDADGRTRMETSGMSAVLPADAFPPAGGSTTEAGPAMSLTARTGTAFRAIVAPGQRGDSDPARVVIQVALDRSREQDLLASYRKDLWPALGVALLVCAVAGYQIARRGLRPLAKITAAARRIRSTTLHERIATAGLPAELSILAARFNEMLDRLEEAFDRLARFAADIAHELRTPVNNLRGEAEVALGRSRSPEEYREILGSCLEETGRLARLIDNLLFVARAESPQAQIAREARDVGHELETLRDYYEAAAAEASVALVVDAAPGLIAALDRTLFQRALGNLVANALAHTPQGGTITLRAVSEGESLAVEVADTGGGIAPEHLPHIFDRFYRADPARSTAAGRVGLGLAIVKAIAALHRGTTAVESEVGKGTRIRLTFPRGGAARAHASDDKMRGEE
jgi:two-component system heavy metal sensor histidine kinase CusS